MELVQVADFLYSTSLSLFNSLKSDWGILGLFILSSFLLIRVANFMRRFFK